MLLNEKDGISSRTVVMGFLRASPLGSVECRTMMSRLRMADGSSNPLEPSAPAVGLNGSSTYKPGTHVVGVKMPRS